MIYRNLFKISLRYLIGKQRQVETRALAPMLSIALSITTVVIVLNVSNGMIQGIITKFIETGIYHINASTTVAIDDSRLYAYQDELRQHTAVRAVILERDGSGLLAVQELRQGVTIRALSQAIWQEDMLFRENIDVTAGVFDLSQRENILIGKHLADQMRINVGDAVKLITIRQVGNVTVPRINDFVVKGIFSAGYRNLDRAWVFIPFENSLEVLTVNALQTVIGIKVAQPFALPNPISRVTDNSESVAAFSFAQTVLSDQFRVSTWYLTHADRFLGFQATKNILLFITVLIICVAMSHIVSSLSILVIEKKHEIAIMKSFGMHPHAIQAIFIACGFIIGIIGGAVGMLLGTFASIKINEILTILEIGINFIQNSIAIDYGINLTQLRNEFYLTTIPIVLSLKELLAIYFGTIVLAVASGFIPAKKATAILPLQILQGK